VGLAGLSAVFGAYVLVVPVAPDDFESVTGIPWTTFLGSDLDAAGYLEREARLLSATVIGFAGLAFGLLWFGFRDGLPWVAPTLSLVPLTYGLSAAIFLAASAIGLGVFYAIVAGIAAVAALANARGRVTPSPQ
jgi:hypothetical protein